MTQSEAAQLLAVAAAFDRRTVGEPDAVAWADALADVNPGDALEAVRRHYRDSTDYLMPVHVRRLVKEIRAERLAAVEEPPPPAELTDDPEGYIAWTKRVRRQIADGERLPDVVLSPRPVRELVSGAFREVPQR